MKLKYFTYEEFDSPDVQGSGQLMNEELLNMLDAVRKKYGKSIVINSGYRTAKHNAKVGGIPEIIGDNGVLIENINYKKLRKNLIELLKNNSLRESYQQKAWKNFKLSSALSSKKLDDYRRIIFQNYY